MREMIKRGDLVRWREESGSYVMYSFVYGEMRGGRVLGLCLSDVVRGGSMRVYVSDLGRELVLSESDLEKMKG